MNSVCNEFCIIPINGTFQNVEADEVSPQLYVVTQHRQIPSKQISLIKDVSDARSGTNTATCRFLIHSLILEEIESTLCNDGQQVIDRVLRTPAYDSLQYSSVFAIRLPYAKKKRTRNSKNPRSRSRPYLV